MSTITPEQQARNYRYYVEPQLVNDLTRRTLVLVLAGGEGSRLHDLTRWRAKPAVPFGGKFRIIDFALSNCINSGMRRICVLTQYRAHSLIRHIQRAWSFLRAEIGEFVEILPAQQRTLEKRWYKGTADALYQNIDIIGRHSPDYVMVLGGDHIYAMDYSRMLLHHVENNAELTVGCIEVPIGEASRFGIMSVDEESRITRFDEKPSQPQGIPGKPDTALASMGIYIFSTRKLYHLLHNDAINLNSTHDFGKDIVPYAVSRCRVFAYRFTNPDGTPAYWRDVGTVDSYWEANIELCGVEPELNLYNRQWPIWTYQTQLPPAKFVFDDDNRRGCAIDSLISAGVIVSGARVKRSIVFFGCRVGNRSSVRDSVVLPKVIIGDDCRISNAIIDKGCVIPDGTVIGEDLQQDSSRYHVTPRGIRLVTPAMLGQHLYELNDPLLD
jgi:glucose-1-phosphate adenylyltransferase